jgi:hypothetical protein
LENPLALCNRERMEIVKLSPSPTYWSTLVPKFIEHAITNQGSIGVMNRMPQWWWMQEAWKSCLRGTRPSQICRINLIEPDGNESVGFYSHQEEQKQPEDSFPSNKLRTLCSRGCTCQQERRPLQSCS